MVLAPGTALVLSLVTAAEPRWGLTFKSPDACLTPAELAEGIERRVGRSLFGASPELTIEGYLKADGPKAWRARLTLVDAQGAVKGSREVTARGASCHAIDEALVLIAAVMIDPAAALRGKAAPPVEPARAPEPEPPPPPPTYAPVQPPALFVPRVPPREQWPGYVMLDAGNFTQDGRWMSRSTFYRVVGRPELGDAYARRLALRSAAYVLGSVSLTAGMLLSALQPLNPGCYGQCTSAPTWPIVSGLITVGVGLVAIIFGAALPAVPTSTQEDLDLADSYNAKLKPPVLPVTASL